ncbi:toll/interleukin-1 receptor domain-containing protein [Mycobacterium deserti]|uniref:Toll/interleukin-1 receptor domain-containing protein n=1 Tax=Mycobacterium deserti TaxID=2978347 RepID=A0ABT2M704_9MYCO|nr:toll/interleukin-1 receptor domain-containing protein [Mycobacterium deserti]MCT7658040.1 toll/interleukin-1 receptor domain-containing protein [Mycobacterium deserti]
MTAARSQPDGHVFLSYPQQMRAQAEVLRDRLDAHGVTALSSAWIQPGADWQKAMAESIRDASLCVVLISVHDPENREQQFETSQILEAAWSDPELRVAVVAPAVRAIPSALRHQRFVQYFANDEVGLDSWTSNPLVVEQFVDKVLLSAADAADDRGQPPPDDETIDQWRNRLVHVGRGDIPKEQRTQVLEQLRNDLEAASIGLGVAAAQDPQPVLNRGLLAESLGDPDLARSFYTLLKPTDFSEARPPAVESADIEYSRALASLEVSEYDEALAGFTRAADLNASLRGPADPRTVAAEYNAGVAAARSGKQDAAASHYERALDRAREGLGDHHTQTAAIAKDLAQIYTAKGRTADAVSLLQLAAEAYRLVAPEDSPEFAGVIDQLHRLGA